MADQNPNAIPVYFIGTRLLQMRPSLRPPIYNIKGRVYQPPTHPDGTIQIGGLMLVQDIDVDELIEKSRMNGQDGVQYHVFTRDPEIAAGIRQRFESGDLNAALPVVLTANQTVSVLTTDAIRAAAESQLSIEELERILAARKAALPTEEPSEEAQTPSEETPVEPQVTQTPPAPSAPPVPPKPPAKSAKASL